MSGLYRDVGEEIGAGDGSDVSFLVNSGLCVGSGCAESLSLSLSVASLSSDYQREGKQSA